MKARCINFDGRTKTKSYGLCLDGLNKISLEFDNTNTITKTFTTSYAEAVRWLHNDYVLCNNITEVDPSVYDNMRFSDYNEEDDTYTEIYQWFLTDASESDVQYLEKHFELKFTYSDKLDCFVLCVDHLGTSWDYVSNVVNCYGEDYPRCKTFEELTGYKY